GAASTRKGDSPLLLPLLYFSRATARSQAGLNAEPRGCASDPAFVPERSAAVHAGAEAVKLPFWGWGIHGVCPVGGQRAWAGAQKSRRAAIGTAAAQAGPWPVLGLPHQPGAQRIPLHVAQHRQQVIIVLNREGFVAALPEMAAAVMDGVVAADMSGQQPLHEPAHVAVTLGP